MREIEMRDDPKKLFGGMYCTEARAELMAFTELARRCNILPVLNISMLILLLLLLLLLLMLLMVNEGVVVVVT